MGVSFKISKVGKRYTPQGGLSDENETQNDIPTISNQPQVEEMEARQGDQAVVGDTGAPSLSDFAKSGSLLHSEDPEVSFSVNLFPNGFNVGKQDELFQHVPKDLLPYDRQAESIFSAIEHGCIPGDVFDGIPCKYVNGAIACEVRDYRASFKEGEIPSSPKIEKVVLRMGMEQVIKYIASVADDTWTYSNILEMEARVLKALHPVLNLSPKPMLDGFQQSHPTKKLNFGISLERKKRRIIGEFLQQQHLGSQAGSSFSSEVHQERYHLDPCIEAGLVHGSTDTQRLPLPLSSTSCSQQPVFEAGPTPNAGLDVLTFQQASFDAGNRKDAENISEPQSQPPRPSPRVRAKAPLTQGKSKKSGQSRQKNTTENTTCGNEALTTSQVVVGGSKCLSKEASKRSKGKAKTYVNNSVKNIVASLPNTASSEIGTDIVNSHANTGYESGATAVANVLETPVPCSSAAVNPVLVRLVNIKNVSESYGLHIKKHKDCWTNDKRAVYGETSMVAFHLENAGADRGSSHYAAGPPHSSYAGVCKITTLTFVCVSRVFSQGILRKCIETKRKLILRERPDEGRTEAITVFEHEWPGQIQTFLNSKHAKLFAFQFILLMNREGYNLIDEQVESVPVHYIRSGTMSQQSAASNNASPAAFELPQLSPSTRTNSPSTSNLSRGHGNVQLGQQQPAVSQLDPIIQQWNQQQHLINSARIRHQLAQRKIAMGASVGPVQIRPGTAGIGSVDGQGSLSMSGSMVQENGGILPMGRQVAGSDMPSPGLVNQQNVGPPSQTGSDQQLDNGPVFRHESPQLDSAI